MPHFEVFRKRMVPLVKTPYVTIQKRGTMSFNKAAHAALGAPKAVELLFDPDERIVGVRGVDPSEPHAYAVRDQAHRETTFVISGTAFTGYYGIPTEISRRWSAYMDDGVLCIDLKQPGTEVTSNRNGHRKESEAESA
jgi:hypothetical protein